MELGMKGTGLPPGVGSLFELGIRFATWADNQRTPLSYRLVMSKFGISRATAFKWLRAWKNQRNIH
jgi:hypothetical protein